MLHKSEYDRAFKAQLKCRAKTYGDNFDYRVHRRDTECRHSVDPFVWDLEEWDDVLESERSSIETPCSDVGSRPASVPLHKYKHHLFNEMYKAKLQNEHAAVVQRKQLQEQQAALAKQQHVMESNQSHQPVKGGGRVDGHSRKTTKKSSEKDRKQRAVRVVKTKQIIDKDEKLPNTKNLPNKPGQRKARVRVNSGVQTDLSHKCSREVQTPDWDLYLDIEEDSESESEDMDSLKGFKNGIPKSVSTASTDPSTPASSVKEKTKETPPERVHRKKPSTEVNRSLERPRNPQIKKPLPQAARPRPKSAPVRAMQSAKPVKVEQPPFLPYGYKDTERETGVKKTYNVRASHDVYPSALRALRIREGMRHSDEQPSVAPHTAFRNEAVFDHEMNQETAKWDTEYRSHYPIYEASEYKRNVMHRLQPRKPRAFFYIAGQA